MVYNKSTVTFSEYLDQFKKVAKEDHQFGIGENYHEKEIYAMYEQGMDVHEAINEYLLTLSNNG